MNSRALASLCLTLAVAMTVTLAQDRATEDVLREKMDALVEHGSLEIRGTAIRGVLVQPAYYRAHDFRPAWQAPGAVDELLGLIDASSIDGLVPSDYHRDAILELAGATGEPGDAETAADLDILCTDAFLTLGYHLRFGKVDPKRLDPNWNIYADLAAVPALVDRMSEFLGRGDGAVARATEQLRPPYDIYANLSLALVTYRGIGERGGWTAVPSGRALREGDRDARIVRLRQRLLATGDLVQPSSEDDDRFDEPLAEAVRRFQSRHGLTADGVVGKNTLAALNVPVEARIDEIRVNLERLRWVMQQKATTFVVVNIAGFELYYLVDDQLRWRSRVQVGKEYRKTPVFRGEMDHLVFNPTWTVPPTVLKRDLIPKAAENPAYLDDRSIRVIDRSGKTIPAADVDWSRYRSGGFPYTLRQEPGPNNALGRVKFMFPNEHFVYIHDTPSRALFSRTKRTFSSGCIRVEHPLTFAEILLDDPATWSLERIEDLVETSKTTTVRLDRKIPVFLLYWTAFVLQDGLVNFRNDIYGRDDAILEDLDSAPRGRERHFRQRGR